MNKFVYFEPRGGFNDILCCIERCINYCKEEHRTLLINGMKSTYNINFSNYFDICSDVCIIIDTEKINEICLNNKYTIYPREFQYKIEDILKGKIQFNFPAESGGWVYNNIKLELFNKKIDQDIIIYSCCGGDNGYPLFKQLSFKTSMIDICKERYDKLNKPYLGIQIRNTDRKCDYINFYNKNENLIKSYTIIYIATDDIEVLNFFKDKKISFLNFTTFPTNKYRALHISDVDSHIKFVDMISDLFILSLSDKLLSPSEGNFIKLIKSIAKNNYFNYIV